MIKSVTVINPKGESLKLTLSEPELSGLIVQEIEGLGPGDAAINTTELATMHGSVYSSSRVNERNIVITLRMMNTPTIEDSRQKTYRYFPIAKLITLRFETDNRLVEIEGYVEKNEPDIFSEEETTQISIICPDPFFYALGSSDTIFSGVQPLFEFPFSNESLTDNLIEFGMIRLDNRALLTYNGDADTGILITIHALDTVGDLTLYNVDTRESIFIDMDQVTKVTGAPLAYGEDIIISTIKGKKYARLLRDGVYINVISAINKDADWFQLTPGDNMFTFAGEEGADNVRVTFSYKVAYGGI